MKAILTAWAITVATLVTWVATGRDAYTKFEVVEHATRRVDESDPLAGTGFYDDESAQDEVIVRDEFHLGFLPTPQGFFDKHLISVGSILGLTWGLWLLAWWVRRHRKTASRALGVGT